MTSNPFATSGAIDLTDDDDDEIEVVGDDNDRIDRRRYDSDCDSDIDDIVIKCEHEDEEHG